MLDIFATYATDEALENTGTWRKLGDAQLLIARLGNPAYAKLMNQRFEENREVLSVEGPAADKKSDEMMAEVMAKTILLGWKNVGVKGQLVSYSTEKAQELLMVKDFRAKVRALADDMDAYRIKQENVQGEA